MAGSAEFLKKIRQKAPRENQRLKVTFETLLPSGANLQEVKDYIHELEWAGGCRHPSDPLSNSIRVIRVRVDKMEPIK